MFAAQTGRRRLANGLLVAWIALSLVMSIRTDMRRVQRAQSIQQLYNAVRTGQTVEKAADRLQQYGEPRRLGSHEVPVAISGEYVLAIPVCLTWRGSEILAVGVSDGQVDSVLLYNDDALLDAPRTLAAASQGSLFFTALDAILLTGLGTGFGSVVWVLVLWRKEPRAVYCVALCTTSVMLALMVALAPFSRSVQDMIWC